MTPGFIFSWETGFPVLAGNEKFPEFRNFQDFPIENDLKFKFRISTFSDRISVFSDRKILLGIGNCKISEEKLKILQPFVYFCIYNSSQSKIIISHTKY